jgi:hypothetical protein
MFIVAEAGVVLVWEHWHMWSIRSISDASVEISRVVLGVGVKANIMQVREVSVREVMVLKGSVVFVLGNKTVNWKGGLLFVESCQETSTRDTSNKHSLELCASIVNVLCVCV